MSHRIPPKHAESDGPPRFPLLCLPTYEAMNKLYCGDQECFFWSPTIHNVFDDSFHAKEDRPCVRYHDGGEQKTKCAAVAATDMS